jgi:saccharopine dehydrogenase (NAD+, L-lysine-forming)
LLGGKLNATGVIRPIQPEVYNLILDEMATLGVKFVNEQLAQILWIRAEVKIGEERAPITPEHVKELVSAGFKVFVEHSSMRCFPDSEYEKNGATLVPANSWVNAPLSAIIFGLKEHPEVQPEKLEHRHIYFSHSYKYQDGWKQLLKRFVDGKGMVWDIEFLVDDKGRRVAAFGRSAGIVGSALGILTWAVKTLGEPFPELKSWSSSSSLATFVKSYLDRAVSRAGYLPSVLVLGALGRCGTGASWFAEQVGIKSINWDLSETQSGGPFPQLLEIDILVNSIYLTEKTRSFLTKEMLSNGSRKLSVISDVSCDSNNPNNPLPIYSGYTNLVNPVMSLEYGNSPLHIVAIDHLPTLIPSESSREFSNALLSYLKELLNPNQSDVWNRAADLFFKKSAESIL